VSFTRALQTPSTHSTRTPYRCFQGCTCA